MSQDASAQRVGILLGAGVAMLAGVALLAWWLADVDEPPRDATAPAPQFEPAESGELAQIEGAESPSPAPSEPTETARGEERADARPSVRTEAAAPAGDTSPESGGAAPSPDAGPTWRDPVNRKVLGKKQWMAQPSEEEQAAIDEAFARPRPQRYPIDLQVRREGIEAARGLVYDCFDALRARNPAAYGRIIVGFDVRAGAGRARLRNVAIPTNFNLTDPQFEACVIDELSRVSFSSSEEGTMYVEYPFLFDDR